VVGGLVGVSLGGPSIVASPARFSSSRTSATRADARGSFRPSAAAC